MVTWKPFFFSASHLFQNYKDIAKLIVLNFVVVVQPDLKLTV